MPPLTNQPLNTLVEYVRLADAYQHIGKIEFGGAWVDHEIGVFSIHGPKAISLANPEFIQPRQKRIIEPQYKRLTNDSIKQVTAVALDRDGITRHASMEQFMEKLIRDEAFQLRLTNGLERKSFSELKEEDVASIHFDYPKSTLVIVDRDGKQKTYDVFVGAASLKRCLTSLASDRKRRAKSESNAGRKVNTASQQTNQIIVAVAKHHPQIKVVKELAQLAQKQLQENGQNLSVGAIEKRISRYNLLALQPSTSAKKT